MLGIAIAAVLMGGMIVDTTVVKIGSDADAQADEFSPEQYGSSKFPEIQASAEDRAVKAETLARAIDEDKAAAGEQYGIPAGIGPVIPVRFTGVVENGRAGIYRVVVEGVPSSTTTRVQTGPVINGTDLRDATGEIAFGQFTNQIEYQNAGAAINEAMKREVLAGLDTQELTGKTVSVIGVFKLINPNNWLVTPVRMSVK